MEHPVFWFFLEKTANLAAALPFFPSFFRGNGYIIGTPVFSLPLPGGRP
jgi:hypothetical protein